MAGLKRLVIDENYLGKTHKYITVVLDLDTRAIVSVARGRGPAALKGFCSRLKQASVQIKAVSTDMAGGIYRGGHDASAQGQVGLRPFPCREADEREVDSDPS